MYYVGFCSCCGEGTLGLRVCAGGQHVAVLCDECDACWPSGDTSAAPTFSKGPELPCPTCGATLLHAPSRWATSTDLEKCGWSNPLLGWGEALGET